MKVFNGLDELRAAAGTHVGASDWMTVDQSRVDTFADATEDHQWIHVDPERAKDGPFGAPIAHGFLTLSLLSHLLAQVYRIEGTKMGINYGLTRCGSPRRSRSAARSAVWSTSATWRTRRAGPCR